MTTDGARKTILLVEDEQTLLATLRYTLEREGYRVVTASDGERALSEARTEQPNLILLDLMLPILSGLEVCRILRRDTATPILMLTAKGEEADKVIGLELGADDYVTKPFGMRELLARVHALLRRSVSLGDAESVTVGDLVLDFKRREVFRAGEVLDLKPRELDLLAHFSRNRGRAFSREQLLREVWGLDFYGDSRTVDVHISWLRRKIEDDPHRPRRLVTVRGVGYRFEG